VRIFVTGGAGFIGSHLVDSLIEHNHDVIVYDNLFRGKIKNIEDHIKQNRIKFIEGDIRDYDLLEKSCRESEMVYHLAAQSNVIGAVTNLDYSFQSNAIGTYNVLKAAHENNIIRFVFSSSREVYGEAQYTPVDENHPLLAKNAYGASKIAGEVYCGVFRKMGMDKLTVLRLANVYGTRDFDRVIPIFLNNMNNNEPLKIFGGKQLIDFVSVERIVNVFLEILNKDMSLPDPVNIGSGKGTSLFKLVERLEAVFNKKAQVNIEPSRDVEVKKFVADVDKMQEKFSISHSEDPLYFVNRMVI